MSEISQQPRALGPKGKTRTEKSPYLTGWKKELWDWSKALIVAFVIVLLLKAYVFQLSTVKHQSMQPTLYENEWLFINKIAYEFGDPKRGDVVILKDPSEDDTRKEHLVKRIIGMPGDTLEIRNGQLYINGELKVESYTDVKIEDGDYGPVTVTPDHYFVMGDNRHLNGSKDSRTFNEVPISMIEGRGDFILWPISKWAKL
ncbi:signal peptidase I [Cohnella yongneupensis]|uniref:Signal peptidase I n=1 Tax=Cohnella yongneupensis TaxID=425006 RepID=A0ABW0R543_9BACL